MPTTQSIIRESIQESDSRFELWTHFIQAASVRRMVEVGVYQGAFAEHILQSCESIAHYYMIDPWRNLNDWEKPANKSDDIFEQFLAETMARTEFAAEKRVVLRGKTTEVLDEIADDSLDFAYIDGDHTLRGIAIDLIRVFAKVKDGGWIAGDDLSKSIWQHPSAYEPTLIFPFAVYFAEAMNSRIYALPYAQFIIEKDSNQPFSFIDLTGDYQDLSLKEQLRPLMLLKLQFKETFPALFRFLQKMLHRLD